MLGPFLNFDRFNNAGVTPGQSHDCRWSGINGTGPT